MADTKRLNRIEESIRIINGEMGEVKNSVAGMARDIDWLKKLQWAILVTLLAGVLTQYVNF